MANTIQDPNTEDKDDNVSFLDIKNRNKFKEQENKCDIHDEECLSCGS